MRPIIPSGAMSALASLPGANPQRSMQELRADWETAQSQNDMAAQLMNAGYVPNSGGLGAIAQIFSAFSGNRMKNKADKKLSELAKESFAIEREDLRKKQESEAKAIEAEISDLEKLLGDRAKATAVARGHAKISDFDEPENKFTTAGGFTINTRTGESSPIEGYAEQQRAIAAAGRGPAAPSAIDQKVALLQKAGATNEQIIAALGGGRAGGSKEPSTKDKQSAADRVIGVENVENLLRQLEQPDIATSAGPLDQFLPGENREKFNALVAQLIPEMKRSQRTSGEGTFTDADLAALQQSLPSLGNRESTNAMIIQNIRNKMNAVEGATIGGEGGGGSGAEGKAIDGAVTADGQQIYEGQILWLDGVKHQVVNGNAVPVP